MEAGQSADTRIRKEPMTNCQGNLNCEHPSMHHAVGHVSHHASCIMHHASCNQDNERAIGRSLVSEWKTETGTSLPFFADRKRSFLQKARRQDFHRRRHGQTEKPPKVFITVMAHMHQQKYSMHLKL
uniref:Uncharacterized protein n=1 Tax=Populus alba TaxID=43335 RepID=A0A4U5NPU2_POPAL|nr:hypothetical protein D5086_0000245390 [Populus alba]